MTKPTLLVLAAGMGSRYGGLKQIDSVGPSGEIIIDYSIYDAIKAGFGKVVFVIRRDIEAEFKQVIGSRFAGKIEVDYVYQKLDALPDGYSLPAGRTKPWGTAHAILAAKDAIKEPFAVINADDFYGARGYQAIGDYLRQLDNVATSTDYTMVGYLLKKTLSEHGTVSRGVCQTDTAGKLTEIIERTHIRKRGDAAFDEVDKIELTGDEYVSMNLWGFSPLFFEQIEEKFKKFLNSEGTKMKSEFFIGTVIMDLIKEKTASITLLTSQDSWFGVTYPEDKPAVIKSIQTLVDAKEYPHTLYKK